MVSLMQTARTGMRNRGFTLIEVMAVITITALLLALVAPRYFGQVDASKDAALRENLRLTRTVIGQFYGDIGRYPNSLTELVEKRYLRSLPMDPITASTDTWRIEPVPEGFEGQVYDLHSGAPGNARNGTPYAAW